MSGEALYERYKDALRRGHVASLRGRLEEALTAYAEAAAIAPERATPHTSAGTALMRRKRPADAVRHYTTAVRLAPRDEAALLGRAQALAALDKRPQAGDAYDAVAEVQAANGKLADAVDSARRGLELAEGRERRRTLERLIERLRATEPAESGRVALEKAMVVLEGRAIERKAAVARAPAAEPAAKKGKPPARESDGSTEIDADVVAAVAAKANAASAPAEAEGAAVEPTTAGSGDAARAPSPPSPSRRQRPIARPSIATCRPISTSRSWRARPKGPSSGGSLASASTSCSTSRPPTGATAAPMPHWTRATSRCRSRPTTSASTWRSSSCTTSAAGRRWRARSSTCWTGSAASTPTRRARPASRARAPPAPDGEDPPARS